MSEVRLTVENVVLEGDLHLSEETDSVVIFAHGSGSSRHSPRNQSVARVLREAGLGTFLFDLLTAEEEAAEAYTRHLRFNIQVLADRLAQATRWVLNRTAHRDVVPGYFGSSTGAAAALAAAATLRDTIGAIVSRGGRPDLAGDALERVSAPTLLIVGGADTPVIPLNEDAYGRLRCEKGLRIVPGASHLFEEPGALEQVSGLAARWFGEHLQPMKERENYGTKISGSI